MKIKPLGFFVLIEMFQVKNEGLIELPQELLDKEQEATDIGWVRAIGPTAYVGYPGCEAATSSMDDVLNDAVKVSTITPADCWGLKVGQKIEYRRFEGKKSAVKGYENYRYIPDSHIIGAIDDE